MTVIMRLRPTAWKANKKKQWKKILNKNMLTKGIKKIIYIYPSQFGLTH